jgi:hypothetical protein
VSAARSVRFMGSFFFWGLDLEPEVSALLFMCWSPVGSLDFRFIAGRSLQGRLDHVEPSGCMGMEHTVSDPPA